MLHYRNDIKQSLFNNSKWQKHFLKQYFILPIDLLTDAIENRLSTSRLISEVRQIFLCFVHDAFYQSI